VAGSLRRILSENTKILASSVKYFSWNTPGAVLNVLYSSHLAEAHLTFELSCIFVSNPRILSSMKWKNRQL